MNIFEKYPNSTFLKSLRDPPDAFDLRERIGELFQFLDGLEDPHFEKELDRDPHARLWEMMVARILRSEGHALTSATHGPDFVVVEADGTRVFIEAICPGPGDEANPNSVPPLVYGAPIAQYVPVSKIVLRIRSALEEKKRKYAQYLEQATVSEKDVCVVAVNSSKIGRAFGLMPPAIMRATHGLGNPYIVFGQGDEGVVAEGIESRSSIPKANGQGIDTTFLLSGANSLISGVLYSDSSFFSLDFGLLEKSLFIHNPKARAPLPVGFFAQVQQIWTICCHDSPQWRAYRIGNAQGVNKV